MQDFRPVRVVHEGAELVGQLLAPSEPGPHPGVLVMASAMGLGAHYRERARRLAGQGYVALATDMYGNGAAFSAPEDAGASYGRLVGNQELVRSRTMAWYETLRRQPEVDPDRIAAIGYCFGGLCVLELARSSADAKAVVSFHGTLTTTQPARPGAIKALVAVYTGALDPFAPSTILTLSRTRCATQMRGGT